MPEETTLCGRVAYDVENAEWVMFVEDSFANATQLYAGINGMLRLSGAGSLKVGDEITITVKRDVGRSG
jgi:hypothetical protein